jgi:hypothetical protein
MQMQKQIEQRNGQVITTYVPHPVADAIRARAEAGDRTIAAEVRRAVRVYLLEDERRPS